MRDIFQDENTQGIIQVDANNAFNTCMKSKSGGLFPERPKNQSSFLKMSPNRLNFDTGRWPF